MNPPGSAATPSRLPLGLLALLGGLSALGPFSIDMYLPAFPALAKHFSATPAAVQGTLSAYFVGLALGQLAYGPLTDRIGRRQPLMLGLIIYLLASAGCVFAPSIEALSALRFLQALGACAGMVVARAVLRDLFPPQDMARMLSMLMLVMGVAPIIAPLLGALVETHLGWQALFVALSLYGLLMTLATWGGLPETLREPAAAAGVRTMLNGYREIFLDRRFLGYALAGGIAQSGMFAYIASSSFVFLEVYQLSTHHYALLFGGVALGLIVASQINARLLRRLSPEVLLRRALLANLIGGGLCLTAVVTGMGGVVGLILPLFAAIASLGFAFPNSTAAAMAGFGQRAGMASALLGTLQFSLAGLSSWLSGLLFDGSALPMVAIIFGCGLLAQGVLRLLVYPRV